MYRVFFLRDLLRKDNVFNSYISNKMDLEISTNTFLKLLLAFLHEWILDREIAHR